MKLIQARLCPQCNEVFSSKEFGKTCPSCTNRFTEVLSGLIWRKENRHAKLSLPEEGPDQRVYPPMRIVDSVITDPEELRKFDKRFHSRHYGPIGRCYPGEPSFPGISESHNKSGEQLESKSSITKRSYWIDAGNAIIGFFNRRAKELGWNTFNPIMPCKQHNRRVQNPQALSADKPQPESGVV